MFVGQERVFFGGGEGGPPGAVGVPGEQQQHSESFQAPAGIPSSPENSQPDPNPTQNAPSTATGINGGLFDL